MVTTLKTPITELFDIKYPILLAGMNPKRALTDTRPRLAAAVTNAGGLGVIGGLGYGPEQLREQIREIKSNIEDPNLRNKFGVDLLLPQVGGNARKTNYDYTHGQLDELVDIIIDEGTTLFVSAVGVPPRAVVDKLHKHGVVVMNMIGAVKHVKRALEAGVDVICAQGGEGGGHTGSVPTNILIPAVVDSVRGHMSPLTHKPVEVIAAGGIVNGRSLAAAIMWGASAVWIGTRFICAEEAGASRAHQEAVLTASYDDTVKTLIYTGRPLRIRKTPYVMDWETNRRDKIVELTSAGKLPIEVEMEEYEKRGNDIPDEVLDNQHPFLMGEVAALVHEVKPARAIVDEIVEEAEAALARGRGVARARL
ncbi:2-nitropropane dioxygenase [Dipodascopsis tothii]|uniref:2-nitropropane dioxygenase n=1 Tax=Dipodascopsis tothii TaxID=44089 RepID=UPI0034CFEBFF